MSIASEITRLQNAKNTLKTKLNNKNDEQHQISNETLDEYGDFVDSIHTTPNLQNKSVTIIENGTTSVEADNGYDGLGAVSITTNVPNTFTTKLYENRSYKCTFGNNIDNELFADQNNMIVFRTYNANSLENYVGVVNDAINRISYFYFCDNTAFYASDISSSYNWNNANKNKWYAVDFQGNVTELNQDFEITFPIREVYGVVNGQTLNYIQDGNEKYWNIEYFAGMFKNIEEIKLQNKFTTITQNGTSTVQADSGYDGLGQVNVTTDVPPLQEKDVNFYDYDGTLLYSYTASEFANLTAMPSNPTHQGLTAQGWNWSLADAQDYVEDYGEMNIGQMYITNDGKTRIYIHLEDGRTSPYLGFAVNGSVIVDWGDSNTETVTSNSTTIIKYTQHTYSNAGDYVITLDSNDNIYLINNGTSSAVLTNNSNTTEENRLYLNAITRIELGNNIAEIQNGAFQACTSLKYITIPNNVSAIRDSSFMGCRSLKCIIIPNTVTWLGSIVFSSCISLTTVIMPKNITNFSGDSLFLGCHSLLNITLPINIEGFGASTFSSCSSLEKIIIPNNVIAIGPMSFQNCYSLKQIKLPNSVTTVGSSAFYRCEALNKIILSNQLTKIEDSMFLSCYSLSNIKIPSSVTNIKALGFSGCYGMKYYDFTEHNSIPTLANVSAFNFNPSDFKIIVPDSLYETWKTTTNWSNYASNIVRESEA